MEILARGAAGLMMVILPIALAAYVVRRLRTGWRLVLIGAAAFIFSQVAHIPFNTYLLMPWMERLGLGLASGPGLALAGAAILLGLSAGLFEEGARWLAYRFWISRARSWNEGVTFGTGHGVSEAVILGLLSLATLVQLAALRGQDLAAIVPADQLAAAEAQVVLYWALPEWAAFFAPLERAAAIAIQISLAVIVLQAFIRRGGALWLLAAIGWHALVDAVAVYVGVSTSVQAGSTSGMAILEALIVLMAILSVWILFALRRPEAPTATEPPLPSPHTGPLQAGPAEPARIEESRYLGQESR